MIPDTLIVQVDEYTPVAIINLGALYYIARNQEVFKRVQSGEQVDLPVLTGFSRDDYNHHPERFSRALNYSLDLLFSLNSTACLKNRKVAEIHFDELMGPTVVMDPGAVAIRLGKKNPEYRLPALCRLFERMSDQKLNAHTILLDHLNRPGWVTVKLDHTQVAKKDNYVLQDR